MRYCTYCKIFYEEDNRVERHDDVYEDYERNGGDIKYQQIYQYSCERCGSIYYGIP